MIFLNHLINFFRPYVTGVLALFSQKQCQNRR